MQELDYNAAKKLGMNAILLNRQVCGKEAWLCTWLNFFMLFSSTGKGFSAQHKYLHSQQFNYSNRKDCMYVATETKLRSCDRYSSNARLAQSVEHQTFNLRAKGSSPLSGVLQFFFFFFFFFGATSFLSSQKVSQTNCFYKKYITI